MKTRSAKAKGRRMQDEMQKAILATFPQLEETEVKKSIMGETGIDLHLSAAARKLFPFSVECKNTEKLNVWSALEQAKENCVAGTAPLLVFKRNRTVPYVALPLDEFMALVKQTTTGDDQ